ncbi:MAG: hypothetical protein WBG92_19425, partial [Thiohalocapsa sp.]
MKRTVKFSAVSLALAIAATLAFSGQVQADSLGYIRADAISAHGGSGGGRFTFNRNPLQQGDPAPEFSGALVTDGMPSDGVFYGLCLEPNETWKPNNSLYEVVTLDEAPQNGINGMMTSDKADDLAELLGNVYPNFSDGNKGDSFY